MTTPAGGRYDNASSRKFTGSMLAEGYSASVGTVFRLLTYFIRAVSNLATRGDSSTMA